MSSQASDVENTIFSAAQALLESVGESFTMEQLETKANVSRATIYRRVGSKEKLLTHLAAKRGESYEPENLTLEILKAARVVFGREGLVAATVEQIAAEAEVGVATIYRRFGDKDNLVKTFIKEMTPRTTVKQLALHPSNDVQADLEKIVAALLPFFYENRNIFRLVLMGNERDRQYLEGFRERSDSTQARLSTYFEVQLKAGQLKAIASAEDLALSLMGIVIAYSVLGPIHHGKELTDSTHTSKLITRVFLQDLRGNAA